MEGDKKKKGRKKGVKGRRRGRGEQKGEKTWRRREKKSRAGRGVERSCSAQ